MISELPIQTDNWQLSKLRHESDDVIVEVIWQQGLLKVVIETNKAVNEKICHNIAELQQEIAQLLGQKRAIHILSQWHEVSYRKLVS